MIRRNFARGRMLAAVGLAFGAGLAVGGPLLALSAMADPVGPVGPMAPARLPSALDAQSIVDGLRDVADRIAALANAGIAQGYRHAPTLTIALLAMLALPVLAAVGGLVHVVLARRRANGAVNGGQGDGFGARFEAPAKDSADVATEITGRKPSRVRSTAQSSDTTDATGPSQTRPKRKPSSGAFVVTMDVDHPPVPLGGLLRIGREDDNDLRLALPTVHRYHAWIERAADGSFAIHDLSGPEGNGVLINGVRAEHAALRDGDEIGLGGARFTFATTAATVTAAEKARVVAAAPGGQVEIGETAGGDEAAGEIAVDGSLKENDDTQEPTAAKRGAKAVV